MKIQNLLLIVVLVLLAVLNIQRCQDSRSLKSNLVDLFEVPTETRIKTIYGDSVNQVTIAALELSKKELAKYGKLLAKQDSTIRLLVALTSKKAVSATYYNTTTNIVGSTDTIVVTNTVDGFPTYQSNLVDRWYTANITAGKDSTKLELSLENPFHVELSQTQKLFKRELFVTVTPLNPYSKVVTLRSFVAPKPKFQINVGADIRVTNKALMVGGVGDFSIKKITLSGVAGYSTYGVYYGVGVKYNIF